MNTLVTKRLSELMGEFSTQRSTNDQMRRSCQDPLTSDAHFTINIKQ